MNSARARWSALELGGIIMAEDLKLTHAREFTTIEVQGLTLWNALQDAGNRDLAQSLLDATLMHEHYTSLLDNNVANRAPAEIVQQAALRARFDEQVQAAVLALAQQVTARVADANRKLSPFG